MGMYSTIDATRADRDGDKSGYYWNFTVSNKSYDAKGVNFTELSGEVYAKSEAQAKQYATRRYAKEYVKKIKNAGVKNAKPLNALVGEFNQSDIFKVTVTPKNK